VDRLRELLAPLVVAGDLGFETGRGDCVHARAGPLPWGRGKCSRFPPNPGATDGTWRKRKSRENPAFSRK
jgi:hypothetical protein